MDPTRTECSELLCPRSAAFVAVLSAVLVLLPGWPVAAHDVGPLPRSSVAASIGDPTLTVDPASWWLEVGNSTTLAATWTPGPPGCSVDPDWFLWTAAGGSVIGSLSDVMGASVNFTALANRSGTETILVRSAGSLECGASSEPVWGSTTSSVTVVARLSLVNLSIGPGPLRPGTTADLTGTIVGGLGPYLIGVDWADGSRTALTMTTPGTFSVPHAFPGGKFDPSVSVSDAVGSNAEQAAPEPIEVTLGPAVSIETSSSTSEVGVPSAFSARFVGTPDGYPPFAMCGEGSPLWISNEAGGENFSCDFSETGLTTVLVGLGSPNRPIVSNTLSVAVEAPLSAVAFSAGLGGELGAPSPIDVGILGGSPPFDIAALALGNPEAATLVAESDGDFLVPVDPTESGTLPIFVNVTDALGVVATAVVEVVVAPLLDLAAEFERSFGSAGSSVAVNALVTEGSPPFFWWVNATNGTWSSAVPPAGVTAAGSPFSWSGTVDPEHAETVSLEVLDASGAEANDTAVSLASPPFSAQLSASAGPPGEVGVTAEIAGGIPPYELYANASDGESWTASSGTDGLIHWWLPAHAIGPVVVSLTVLDRFGLAVRSNATVDLVPPPASSGTSDEWGALVALCVLGALAVASVFWWRRRRGRPGPSPSPDPEAVLERILEPADGADRSTVELLAEEAGVPIATARTTIDRLVTEGRIRSETSADGEEVLAWSSRSSS